MYTVLKQKGNRQLGKLLKDPFQFEAESLARALVSTEDFQSPSDATVLIDLAAHYDRCRLRVSRTLPQLVPLLALEYRVTLEASDLVHSPLVVTHEIPFPDEHSKQVSDVQTLQVPFDKLCDIFKLTYCGAKAPEGALVWDAAVFLLLADALYLVFGGLAVVRRETGRYVIEAEPRVGRPRLRRRWVSSAAEQQAHLAILAALYQFDLTRIHERNLKACIDAMEELLFDKILSLPIQQMQGAFSDNRAFSFTRSVLRLFGAALSLGSRQQPLVQGSAIFTAADVPCDDLEFIFQLQRQLNFTDQLFQRSNGCIQVTKNGFVHQARGLIENAYTQFDRFGAARGVLGKYFENSHVRRRLCAPAISRHYSIFEGLMAHDAGSGERRGDGDLILMDKAHERYYICQIKYTIGGARPYLLGDVELMIDGTLYHGLQQLRGIRQHLAEGRLDARLEELGLHNLRPDNTDFLLVHNITNLDLQQTHDGIALYEWNTLRNLLQGAQILVGSTDQEPQEHQLSTPLALGNVDELLDHLLIHHGYWGELIQMSTGPNESGTLSFALDGQGFTMIGLGL